MNEQTPTSTIGSEELTDILLVLDKDKKKIQAVKGIDENGDLETVDPKKKNNQGHFMRINKHGDFFSNFWSNFMNQVKNPSRFSFFRVPEGKAVPIARELQKAIDSPTQQGNELLARHEIKSTLPQTENYDKGVEQFTHNKSDKLSEVDSQPNGEISKNSELGKSGHRFSADQIDWETLSNLGISREELENKDLLDGLLKGYKTNELVAVGINLGSAVIRTEGRLSLTLNEQGKAVVNIHCVRKEPQMDQPFFGHTFSEEDKANLLSTGNMGRIVNLVNPRNGDRIPSLISLDRLTNEVVAYRVSMVKIPNEIKGVELNDLQKQVLLEGKPLFLKGMLSNKGTPFDATVQFNADKRFVEFVFDRTSVQRRLNSEQSKVAPRKFRNVQLSEQQYKDFKDGVTIFVKGLVDKNQKPYSGYITFDRSKGITSFSFTNPNKLRPQIQPSEIHKTQIAVNSDGKTNEATKHIKQPLNSGQSTPLSGQQKKVHHNSLKH